MFCKTRELRTVQIRAVPFTFVALPQLKRARPAASHKAARRACDERRKRLFHVSHFVNVRDGGRKHAKACAENNDCKNWTCCQRISPIF